MERLTYDFCIGSNHCWQIKGAGNFLCKEVCIKQEDDGCTNCPIKKAFDRLAAYEDTGLDPEEYKRHADAIKKLDIEHMHGLLQAEMDGRLVVMLPNDPLTLEELREMDGEPVWVVPLNDFDILSANYLVNAYAEQMVVDKFGAYLDFEDYGKTWLAYRRRPEEGTV